MTQAAKTAAEVFKEMLISARDVGGRVWDEMAPVGRHGASELAAALFSGNGNAYVMYQHGDDNQKSQDQALHGPANEVQQPEQEQSRGRDM